MPRSGVRGLDESRPAFMVRRMSPPIPPLPEEPFRVFPANWLEASDWQHHFPSRQPLHVDVGAGKGRFLLARAKLQPEVNFLGIERQLNRVRKVGRKAYAQGMTNLRMLRLEGYYAVRHLFPPASVDVFYVFFPDPWPKARHEVNRICNPDFIAAMHRALVPGGLVHFATDHLPYFAEVVPQFTRLPDWQAVDPFWPSHTERSDFELMFLADKPVGRFSARKI
jgi:tRNA (guanine-N7-)-methyltransferase